MKVELDRFMISASAVASCAATLLLVNQPWPWAGHYLPVIASGAASILAILASWIEWRHSRWMSPGVTVQLPGQESSGARFPAEMTHIDPRLATILRRAIEEASRGDREDGELVRTILEILEKRDVGSMQASTQRDVPANQVGSSAPLRPEWQDSVGLIDPETGLKSRRCFELALSLEIENAKKRGTPLAVVLVYVAQSKLIRSKHGAIAAAEFIRWSAAQITSAVRGRDTVGRFGSQEFVVLLPMTSGLQAATVVRNLKAAFDVHPWSGIGLSAQYRIVPSIGFAEYVEGETSAALIRKMEEDLHFERSRAVVAAKIA